MRSARELRCAMKTQPVFGRGHTPNGGTFFGKENRKHLQTARPKCARATEQIKSPHSPETFAVTICKPGPGAAEVFIPGEQCRVVIRPDVLDVFNDENAFRGACQLERRKEAWSLGKCSARSRDRCGSAKRFRRFPGKETIHHRLTNERPLAYRCDNFCSRHARPCPRSPPDQIAR